MPASFVITSIVFLEPLTIHAVYIVVRAYGAFSLAFFLIFKCLLCYKIIKDLQINVHSEH